MAPSRVPAQQCSGYPRIFEGDHAIPSSAIQFGPLLEALSARIARLSLETMNIRLSKGTASPTRRYRASTTGDPPCDKNGNPACGGAGVKDRQGRVPVGPCPSALGQTMTNFFLAPGRRSVCVDDRSRSICFFHLPNEVLLTATGIRKYTNL